MARMRKVLNSLAALALLASVTASTISAAPVAAPLEGLVELGFVDLVNADRLANGLEPVEFDDSLLPIARERAAAQLGTPELSHFDGNGDMAFANLLMDAGVGYGLAGENLARASVADPSTLPQIEAALMDSPLHRQNILEPSFTRLAIGSAVDPATGQVAYAQIFRAP